MGATGHSVIQTGHKLNDADRKQGPIVLGLKTSSIMVSAGPSARRLTDAAAGGLAFYLPKARWNQSDIWRRRRRLF